MSGNRQTIRIDERRSVGRVLMIAPAFPPSTAAGVHRTVRFVRLLPEFGWQPVVLTMATDSPGELPGWMTGLRVERSRGWRRSSLNTGAARTTSPPPAEPGESQAQPGRTPVWKRLARKVQSLLLETPDREVAWSLPAKSVARRLAAEEGIDAVYTSGPPHSVHLVGRDLKRRLGLPWVADFRDPWARKPWGHKARNPWGQRMLGWFERRCIEGADLVVLNTPRMAEEFRSYYKELTADKFLAIPNGCDPVLMEQAGLLTASAAAEAWNVGEGRPFRLCHVGSLYSRRDPRPVIEALALLRDQGIAVEFEQVGGCKAEFRMVEHASKLGLLGQVRCVPPVAHDEALRRMAAADALLLIQPGTDTQVPGKLFEMLAFRKPILALTGEGATADIIQRYRLGRVVSSEHVPGIAAAIETIVHDSRGVADNGDWEGACRDFDGRMLTGRLAELFNRLTGRAELEPEATDRVEADLEVAAR